MVGSSRCPTFPRRVFDAPNLEIALLLTTINTIASLASAGGSDDGSFKGPSLEDFFPPAIFFSGTPFEINRIVLIRFVVVILLVVFFGLATRRMRLIPTRGQSIAELALGFVKSNIADSALGATEGRRFLPLLTSMFFFILAMNIFSVIPFFNIAGSSVLGLPLVLALVSYVAFIYAGIRKHPGAFFKNSLFPAGVPPILYIIVTPIELLSTFILRPVTLALRLLMNMVAGHMLLVLCFSATQFFLFTAGGFYGLFSVGTLAFGLIFTLFEILVAVLQAYVFTFLTAVYIQLALADEH